MLTFKEHLNPLINKVDTISDYSDIKEPLNDTIKVEYPYLKTTTQTVTEQIKYLLNHLEELEKELEKQVLVVENETGDDKSAAVKIYNQILKQIQDCVNRLNHELDILDVPYFGKIVFNRKADSTFPAGKITSYIGKFAYFDKLTKSSLITDWRAPIANLYYTNSGPTSDVEFVSPMGSQKGDITEKKMLEISKARIKNVYDSKTGNTAADEFLLSQLNQKVGQKLTDIVSTIQGEQNRIIRDDIDKLTVLQGVAGSGKTTIVLHRLAYLFFMYQKHISAKNTLIIAPNKLFLDYISGVLPSLGIDGVEANTYLFWAKKILKWDNKYILASAKPDRQSIKFKGSKEFLVSLVEGFNNYIETLLEEIPYSKSDLIQRNYYDIKRKTDTVTTSEALKLAVEKVKSDLLIKNSTVGSYMQGISILDEVIEEKIIKYFREKLNLLNIYKSIVNDMSIPSDIKERTKKMVRKVKGFYTYEMEDLAPLAILSLLLNGTTEFQKDYVIADEAQDLSFPQIFSLLLISRRNNLMLAGDLAQAIKDPNNIDDWIELIDTLKQLKPDLQKFEYHQLNKCYRTTIEIIDYIKEKVENLFPKTFLRPEAVLRHGNDVIEIPTRTLLTSEDTTIDDLVKYLNIELKLNRNTIAVVTPDMETASNVYNKLKAIPTISEYLVEMDSSNYSSGIIVTPVLNAKGLEFDTVFILDLDINLYPANFSSARKFYVAATRALHQLYITYPIDSKSEIISNDKV